MARSGETVAQMLRRWAHGANDSADCPQCVELLGGCEAAGRDCGEWMRRVADMAEAELADAGKEG